MKHYKKIVIAEDSSTQASRLQFILEENGYTVFHGKDGKEALELIHDNKPDLIISDIMMPGMDGFELTKQVKKDPQLRDIPIILVTMLSSLSDILKGLENGAENYIIKPYEEADLLSKIKTVFKTSSEGVTEFKRNNLRVTYDNYVYKIDSKSTKLADFLITTYENVLKKNKQVEATQNELRSLNESLEQKVKERTSALMKEVTERKQYQLALEESEQALKERVKELSCLYQISELTRKKNTTIDNILKKIVELIPLSWQYPEIAYSKLIFEEVEFISSNYLDTPWKQKSDLIIRGEKKGMLEVGYLKEMSEIDEAQFLKEERNLIIAICERLASFIERMQADEQLAKQNQKYQALNEEYEIQNKELIQNLESLNTVNSKLNVALERAKESDRLKSAFLASMSHELRTPLNAIIGFSDVIDENVPIDEIIGFNHTINASGKHLLSIVEDLFDITLIETGEIKIIKEDVELESILNDVHEIIEIEQQKTKKNHINLKLNIPSKSRNLTLYTDSSKLKQILINLLKNALKFTNEGHVFYGFEIKTVNKKSILKFFVKDTGIGIPKDKQKIIFNVFTRIEDSFTKVYGGTGIGLSISKKLAELLGGKIWLESKEGKGSDFYFTIPIEVYRIADKKNEIKPLKKDKLKKKTVLIVEDNKASIQFLKIVLEKSGIITLLAKDGKMAINCCNENPNIDLVLMDINMPIMNGYEATKKIKQIKHDLPIIAQTAYALSGDRIKAIKAGCDDYISKPIKKEELIMKIEQYLN